MDSVAYRNILIQNLADRNTEVAASQNEPRIWVFDPSFCSTRWIYRITPIALQPEYVSDYYTSPTPKDTDPLLDPVYMHQLASQERYDLYAESIGKTTLFSNKNNGISIRQFYDEQLLLYNSINQYNQLTNRGSFLGYVFDWRKERRVILYDIDGNIISDTTVETSGTTTNLLIGVESSYDLTITLFGGVYYKSRVRQTTMWYTPKNSEFENTTSYLEKDFVEEMKFFLTYDKRDSTLSPSEYFKEYDNLSQTTALDGTELKIPLPPEPIHTLDKAAQYIDRNKIDRYSRKYKSFTWSELFALNPKPASWL